MNPHGLTFDDINLAIGLASFVFGIVALILSVVFFLAATKSEKNSAITLEEISKTTSTLDRLSMKMINRLTTAIIEPSPREDRLFSLLLNPSPTGTLKDDNETASGATKPELEQYRVDNLITALFYCGTTNVASRFHLPQLISDLQDPDHVARMVDSSAADFKILHGWLKNTVDYEIKIKNSPVQSLYERANKMVADVMTTTEHYASKERESVSEA